MASNFVVTPTQIDLSTSTTSALLTLRNLSKTPLRFEVTLFTWSEDEHGAMTLQPSTDVTFFPKLIELAAGTSHNVRLGINAGASRDVERSFRIFVEELPINRRRTPTRSRSAPRSASRCSFAPAKPARSAVVDSVSVAGGKVLTRVRNTGNLHINVDTIAVKGTGASKRRHSARKVRAGTSFPGRRESRGGDVRRGIPVDDRRRRRSVRAQPVPQGLECGVAGCVRCALGLFAVYLLLAVPAAAQERSISGRSSSTRSRKATSRSC